MSRKAVDLPVELIRDALNTSPSALKASEKLNVAFSTFKRYAVKYGLYETNQPGKGTEKPNPKARLNLDDILSNKIPYPSNGLKKKLYEAGLKKPECEECGQGLIHNEKKLVLQLDHTDGNNRNNLLENLRILCPNCHSQTPTFCRGQGKNKQSLGG